MEKDRLVTIAFTQEFVGSVLDGLTYPTTLRCSVVTMAALQATECTGKVVHGYGGQDYRVVGVRVVREVAEPA